MHCEQATKKIHLYIDNRLSLHELRALETHLASCIRCRQELLLLEEVSNALIDVAPVMEPIDLTVNVMQLVAQDVELREQYAREKQIRKQQKTHHSMLLFARQSYTLFRLSLQELLAVLLLASITTLGIILTLPSLRSVLPFTGGDPVSRMVSYVVHVLASMNSGTLTLAFWILGTLLGVCITLALAGNEMRQSWFKAMTDRLPVW
ncbi:MAG TPA: hypothetical protein DHW02_20505 [Ktedonobacter sp.]|nr:hypothetical protein [Ktedonobacter sp.]